MSEETSQPPPAPRPAQEPPAPSAPRALAFQAPETRPAETSPAETPPAETPPAEAPAAGTPPAESPTQAGGAPDANDPANATTITPGRGLRGWYRRRKAETEARWDRILGGVRRTGTVTKVILLHARYTFGYLAAGFMLSAPLTIGMREGQHLGMIAKSVILGVVCAVPFLLLIPFSQIDWGQMRLPEFKNLELALTRYATYAMVGVLVAFGAVQAFVSVDHYLHWLCDVRVAWVNLILMFFTWARTKAHTVLFRDFYTLKPGDDLVLTARPSDPRVRPADDESAGDPALADLAARAAGAAGGESNDAGDTTVLEP